MHYRLIHRMPGKTGYRRTEGSGGEECNAVGAGGFAEAWAIIELLGKLLQP